MKFKKIIHITLLTLLCFTSCGDYESYTESGYESKYATEEPTTEPTAEPTVEPILTEEEYKSLCNELYYDDVFWGEEDLENQYVKLHLFLSEKYYFTVDNMYSSTYKKYYKKYKMNKDFYKCCVLRKEENSYAGRSINMWFSDNYELNPSDYKLGQKIIVYAQVVSWSDNTMDGYNSVTIIPRYIETEE